RPSAPAPTHLPYTTLFRSLSQKARAGKLAPADMQGGCFTISSLGGIGGTAFTPIINAPEVAILGVSRSRIATSGALMMGVKAVRSEEHTSELQSRGHLVCR